MKSLIAKTSRFNLVTGILFVILCMSSCGSVSDSAATPQTESATLMVLPPELSAVSNKLTSTLTVYSTTVTQIYHKSLHFDTNDDGDDIIKSPSLALIQTNHYRFVVVFYWEEEVFAYVDTVLQISSNDTTDLSYSTTDIIYDTSNPNSSLSVPMLYKQDTASLDIDSLTVLQSDDGASMSISADVDSGSSIASVVATFSDNGSVFLTQNLSQNSSSASGLETYDLQVDTAFIGMNEFELSLTVTDVNNNTSTLTSDVTLD